MPPPIFDELRRRSAESGARVVPFHIGDTHLGPPAQSRLGALGFSSGPEPDLYRYAPTVGERQLIESVAAKCADKNRIPGVCADWVQITVGATHGLSCAVRALLDHGDHLLLLCPCWPLIRGIALSAGVVPVDVPFSHLLLRQPGVDVEQLVEEYVTPRTAGIYLANPNNPDGKVLGPEELAAIGRVAQRHDLWIFSDEVYEDLPYDGRSHTSMAAVPGMAERTATVFSFSKSYGQAGLRVGYLVAPPEVTRVVRRLANYTVYSTPWAMQRAARVALEAGEEYLAQVRRHYQSARDWAHTRLGDLCLRPEGATYLWLDLGRYLAPGEEDAMAVLGRLADRGLLLAPGGVFGHAFERYARLCFTAVGREELQEGVNRLLAVLAEIG